jgi:hypothetical protein
MTFPFPHGRPDWTNTQLRTELEKAHNSARDKWGAYLSDLALAYWDAYKNVDNVLKGIAALKKSRAEQAQLFWSVILPAVAGGFLGGIVSLKLKAVLKESGIKFIEHSLMIDTGKTLTSDVAKYTTKKIEAAFAEAVDENPWKPSSVDPAQFAEILRNELLHSMVKIDDGLITSQKSHASQDYRNQMFVLYNSPFIWNAPTENDLDKWRRELWRPLEVFLWVDWANHRDTQYWLKRIMTVTDGMVSEDYEQELADFDPILARLSECNVPWHYITQTIPGHSIRVGDNANLKRGAQTFLNILWVRHLASHYPNTFLGELLTRIQPGAGAQPTGSANLSLRPGAYRLM